MTDTTHEAETESLNLKAVIQFHPQPVDQDEPEDENGNVTVRAMFQSVTFGMGSPKVLIELEDVAEGDEEHDAVFQITVGDLNLAELKDVLQLALAAVERASE